MGDWVKSRELFIANLGKDVRAGTLTEIFKSYGIVSARVCTERNSEDCRGHAYLTFKTVDEAEKALDEFRGTVNGRYVRLMWKQMDRSKRLAAAGNLFVKNIPKTTRKENLQAKFGECGTIISLELPTSEPRTRRDDTKIAYVQFALEKDAEKAIKELNGIKLGDEVLVVTKFKSKVERTKPNLFVKNFGDLYDDEALRNVFERFGRVINAVVMKKPDGKSKGFGFVLMENLGEAMAALKQLNVRNGLYVAFAQTKSERVKYLRETHKGKNLYVKHLDPSMDENRLREWFSGFGEIASAKIEHDGAGRPFAYVCFKTRQAAERAIEFFRGASHPYVALHQYKEEREAALNRAGLRYRAVLGQAERYQPPPQQFQMPQQAMYNFDVPVSTPQLTLPPGGIGFIQSNTAQVSDCYGDPHNMAPQFVPAAPGPANGGPFPEWYQPNQGFPAAYTQQNENYPGMQDGMVTGLMPAQDTNRYMRYGRG